MASGASIVVCSIVAFRLSDDARPYVGAKSVEAAEVVAPDSERPGPEDGGDTAQEAWAARREPSASITPPHTDDADRWRFAFTLHTFGFVAIASRIGLTGAGASAYLGVGIPRQSRARYERHSFGVGADLMYPLLPRSVVHRHRIAATGLVGHDTSFTRRYLSLYYFVGAGAAFRGRNAGGSIGGRVGLGSSQALHYIIALGIDLDILREHDHPASSMALIFSLSLLAFGML